MTARVEVDPARAQGEDRRGDRVLTVEGAADLAGWLDRREQAT